MQALLDVPRRASEPSRPPSRLELLTAYENSLLTDDFVVADGHVSFTPTFKYLGSLLDFLLDDDMDIDRRISKATAAMGILRPFWRNPSVDNKTKHLLFESIPINLLLWG